MVISLPIFGLKQTSLPSPRSSVTNLTSAAAGHQRRNRTGSISTVSAASSGSAATTTTTAAAAAAAAAATATYTSTNREWLTEKAAAAAADAAAATENSEENSSTTTKGTTASTVRRHAGGHHDHHDNDNDNDDGDKAPVKVVGNRSTADTTASLSHEKNETLLTTTNEKNNNTSSIATNSWKDAATGRLQKQDDTSEEEAAERRELNQALSRLAELFPDIKVEVFRELLTRFDGTSRLQVCTEQLLRYRTEWVKGRWNIPGSSSKTADEHVHGAALHLHHQDNHHHNHNHQLSLRYSHSSNVPLEEQFRAAKYRKAVRSLVALEFKALSRSTLDAVLAENNFSYSRARPTLRQLSSKTWLATLENFFTIRRKKSRGRDFDCEDHPSISWRRVPSKYGGVTIQPTLKETDSAELNAELHDLFVGPMLTALREEQESNDLRTAEQLNEKEAKDAGALYECDCCLSDVIFEQIATCSTHGHIICFNCIRRTVQEALFGQGWAKSVDVERATIRCLAISTDDGCDGHLHVAGVKRAITTEKGGQEVYQKFEARLAADSLIKSQLQLIYCPFCSYAEVDPIYHPPPGGIAWKFRRANLSAVILLVVFLIDLFPILIIPIVLAVLLYPSRVCSTFATSFRNLCLRHRSQRFKCANPKCGKASCITCHKEWRDPHVCHEPLLMSLRATVEAARTAAVKRTCPQCGLSFIKSSGCNKLTCVCGYSMCYLCRKALGPPVTRRRQQQQQQQQRPPPPQRQGNGGIVPLDPLQVGPPEDIPEEEEMQPEGYKHFCEHFRAIPGSRCTECDKCDLYRTEDEEDVARRAGEEAERLWRIREGLIKPNARLATTGDASSSEATWTMSEMDSHARDPTVDTPGWNNMENLRIRLDEALASGKGPDLFRTYGPGDDSDWWNARIKYWCWDVWLDGRWRVEGRRLLDSLVDLTVHLE